MITLYITTLVSDSYESTSLFIHASLDNQSYDTVYEACSHQADWEKGPITIHIRKSSLEGQICI
jgi:hypothetical protein